ncbi:TPA: GNAT family N-acetyltransferase [Legionella feeleii]
MLKTSEAKIHLIAADLNDYPRLQNLARFYVYDMSRYCGFLPGWDCPENGLYECYDCKKYFTEKERYPFLIRVDKELAGFVLINKVGTTPTVDWNVGEFFVIAKFQRQGVGQQIAKRIWQQFSGNWEVAVIPQNERGLNFWRNTIGEFSKNQFSETVKQVSYDLTNPRIIFHFIAHERNE